MSNKNSKRKALSDEQLKNAAGGKTTQSIIKDYTKRYFVFNGKRIEYDINNPFKGLSSDERQVLTRHLKDHNYSIYERFVNQKR